MPESNSPGLEVTEQDGAVVVGFIDQQIMNDHRMETMAGALMRIADRLGRRELRLDFAKVEYVQSSVLGKLVSLHKKVTGAGGRLVLCNIGPEAFRVFMVTKLDKLFVIEPAQTELAAD